MATIPNEGTSREEGIRIEDDLKKPFPNIRIKSFEEIKSIGYLSISFERDNTIETFTFSNGLLYILIKWANSKATKADGLHNKQKINHSFFLSGLLLRISHLIQKMLVYFHQIKIFCHHKAELNPNCRETNKQ